MQKWSGKPGAQKFCQSWHGFDLKACLVDVFFDQYILEPQSINKNQACKLDK